MLMSSIVASQSYSTVHVCLDSVFCLNTLSRVNYEYVHENQQKPMTLKCVSPVCDELVPGTHGGEVLGPVVEIRRPGAVSERVFSHLTTPPVPHSILCEVLELIQIVESTTVFWKTRYSFQDFLGKGRIVRFQKQLLLRYGCCDSPWCDHTLVVNINWQVRKCL